MFFCMLPWLHLQYCQEHKTAVYASAIPPPLSFFEQSLHLEYDVYCLTNTSLPHEMHDFMMGVEDDVN